MFDDDADSTKVLSTKDLGVPSSGERRQAYFIIISGRSVGKQFRVTGDRLTVGRQSQCEIMVDDEGVSRKHAFMERTTLGYVLTDNESTNGIFVNGTRLDRHLLKDGDKVQLGQGAVLKFSFQDEMEEKAQRQLYDQATRDELTGAYNKKFFIDQLKMDFAYYLRHPEPLSLTLFDIDHFKKVNDTFGHLAGDFALKTLSSVVQKTLRTEDVFARYGGEEFAIVLKATSAEQAFLVTDRLRRVIAAHVFAFEGKTLEVKISAGVATLNKTTMTTPRDLVAAADDLLYSAKKLGRNRVEWVP
jgi:two-component system, cell cycle response regulator